MHVGKLIQFCEALNETAHTMVTSVNLRYSEEPEYLSDT